MVLIIKDNKMLKLIIIISYLFISIATAQDSEKLSNAFIGEWELIQVQQKDKTYGMFGNGPVETLFFNTDGKCKINSVIYGVTPDGHFYQGLRQGKTLERNWVINGNYLILIDEWGQSERFYFKIGRNGFGQTVIAVNWSRDVKKTYAKKELSYFN